MTVQRCIFFFFTITLSDFKCIEKLREYCDEYPVTHLVLEFVIFWSASSSFLPDPPRLPGEETESCLGSVPSEGVRLGEVKQFV